jgi:superfamily II DNA/RNA helicase
MSTDYIHRIGRTARAGEEGKVINLLSSEDYMNFSKIKEDDELNIVEEQLPEFNFIRIEKDAKRNFSGRRDFSERKRFSGERSFSGTGRREFSRERNERDFAPRRSFSRKGTSKVNNRNNGRDNGRRGNGRNMFSRGRR